MRNLSYEQNGYQVVIFTNGKNYFSYKIVNGEKIHESTVELIYEDTFQNKLSDVKTEINQKITLIETASAV